MVVQAVGKVDEERRRHRATGLGRERVGIRRMQLLASRETGGSTRPTQVPVGGAARVEPGWRSEAAGSCEGRCGGGLAAVDCEGREAVASRGRASWRGRARLRRDVLGTGRLRRHRR
eukprot:2052644-Rhodomonas_salina.2